AKAARQPTALSSLLEVPDPTRQLKGTSLHQSLRTSPAARKSALTVSDRMRQALERPPGKAGSVRHKESEESD
ncbi:hypothetical protein, partial [Streptomyces sp. NPDC003395]